VEKDFLARLIHPRLRPALSQVGLPREDILTVAR